MALSHSTVLTELLHGGVIKVNAGKIYCMLFDDVKLRLIMVKQNIVFNQELYQFIGVGAFDARIQKTLLKTNHRCGPLFGHEARLISHK